MPMINYYAEKITDPKTQQETYKLLTLPPRGSESVGPPMPQPFRRLKDANGVETENRFVREFRRLAYDGGLAQATHINDKGELVKSQYSHDEIHGRRKEGEPNPQARAAEAHELRHELVIVTRDFTAEFEKNKKEKAATATAANNTAAATVTTSQSAQLQASMDVKISIDANKSTASAAQPKAQTPSSQLSTDGLTTLASAAVAQQPASAFAQTTITEPSASAIQATLATWSTSPAGRSSLTADTDIRMPRIPVPSTGVEARPWTPMSPFHPSVRPKTQTAASVSTATAASSKGTPSLEQLKADAAKRKAAAKK